MLLVILAGVSRQTDAATIVLLSSTGDGTYNYGLSLDSDEFVTLLRGQDITLSGLSGVTGASTSSFFSPYTDCGITQTSACFEQSAFGSDTFTAPLGPFVFGTLRVTSTVLTTGLVDFSIQTAAGTITGQVTGPVDSVETPEPATMLLLGAGLLGAGVRRWRQKRT